jgi:hypothetical protein
MAFVGLWASLIVKITMNEVAIGLKQFLPSSTTFTHLSHTFSCSFLVIVCSFSFLSFVVFSCLAYLV